MGRKGGAAEAALLSVAAATHQRAATAAGGAGRRWPSLAVVGIAPEPPRRDDATGFFSFSVWERSYREGTNRLFV
jgi:hypothetical protein